MWQLKITNFFQILAYHTESSTHTEWEDNYLYKKFAYSSICIYQGHLSLDCGLIPPLICVFKKCWTSCNCSGVLGGVENDPQWPLLPTTFEFDNFPLLKWIRYCFFVLFLSDIVGNWEMNTMKKNGRLMKKSKLYWMVTHNGKSNSIYITSWKINVF